MSEVSRRVDCEPYTGALFRSGCAHATLETMYVWIGFPHHPEETASVLSVCFPFIKCYSSESPFSFYR